MKQKKKEMKSCNQKKRQKHCLCQKELIFCKNNRFSQHYTAIFFKPAAIGIPKKPTNMLKNHWTNVRGVVLANVPKNSMIMI